MYDFTRKTILIVGISLTYNSVILTKSDENSKENLIMIMYRSPQ